MAFVFAPGPIDGLVIIEPKVFGDARGYFMETYSERDFAAAGIDERFVQDNQSKSRKGVLRGLHFQKTHPQGKLARVLSGEVWDVVVDLRFGSPSLGSYFGITLSAENKKALYVPAGFAHGFVVLSDEAEFAYKCTDFYHPEDEGGLRWDDPTLALAWPGRAKERIVSEKDARLPSFDPKVRYFA
jgi:dTDP-4-dehydrorhamnose 3,5-epimerase